MLSIISQPLIYWTLKAQGLLLGALQKINKKRKPIFSRLNLTSIQKIFTNRQVENHCIGGEQKETDSCQIVRVSWRSCEEMKNRRKTRKRQSLKTTANTFSSKFCQIKLNHGSLKNTFGSFNSSAQGIWHQIDGCGKINKIFLSGWYTFQL